MYILSFCVDHFLAGIPLQGWQLAAGPAKSPRRAQVRTHITNTAVSAQTNYCLCLDISTGKLNFSSRNRRFCLNGSDMMAISALSPIQPTSNLCCQSLNIALSIKMKKGICKGLVSYKFAMDLVTRLRLALLQKRFTASEVQL